MATKTNEGAIKLKNFAQILINLSLFEGINAEEFPLMLNCLQPQQVSYKKDEYITTVGEYLRGVGVILAGEAAVIKESASGDRVVMTILQPGDIFGEIAAFAENPRWPSTVQAREDAAVLFIPRDRITGRCDKNCLRHQFLITNMLRIISERALMLNQKVNYLTIKSMRGRISAFLLDHCREAKQSTFTLPLNRNEMADFLNVSRPSMSREIGRMKKEGIIDFHLATFRILDPGALQQSAQ